MLKTHIDIILKKYRNKYFHNLIILCVFFSYRIKLMFFIQKNNIENITFPVGARGKESFQTTLTTIPPFKVILELIF